MERQDRMNEEIFYKINDLGVPGGGSRTGSPVARRHSMTHGGEGRVNALDEAVEIAGRRGSMEQVTGKRGRAFDFIIIEPDRIVFVKVKRSQTSFTYVPGDPAPLPARDREPSPRGPDTRNRPGILGTVSQRDVAVLPGFRHDSVLEIRADGMYIPHESLPVTTVDLSGTPADGTDDPVSPSEMGSNPLFWHLPGEYLGRVNPGPLRAPFHPLRDVFCHISAKNRTLLHTFLKYAISLRFRPNGALSFEL